MKKFYVYVYLNPLKPGKYSFDDLNFEFEPFYVGKGANNRIDEHVFNSHIENDKNKLKTNSILKILNNKENVIKIKLYDNLTEEEAFKEEKRIIKLIGRRDLGNGTLVNLTNGGEGSSGRKLSKKTKQKISKSIKKLNKWKGENNPSKKEEHKQLMSQLFKGRQFSDETIKKMSVAKKGKKLSKSHRQKVINGLIGRKCSESTREKISSSNSNKKRSPEVKCFMCLQRVGKEKAGDYVNGIIFLKENMQMSNRDIYENTILDKSTVLKIKKMKSEHWVFYFDNVTLIKIMNNFICLKEKKSYKKIFNY